MRPQVHSFLRNYAGYFRPHWPLLAVVTLAGAAQSGAYLPFAWLLRRIFDVILPARDLPGLLVAAGELLALQVGSLILAWTVRSAALRVGQDVLTTLRTACFRKLYDLPRSFFTDADLEHLHVTFVYETAWIETLNNALVAQILPATLSALVLFAILFSTEPVYALIISVSAPAAFVANRMMVRQAWFREENLRVAFQEFSRGVRFALSAIDLTKSHAAEEVELEGHGRRLDALRGISLEVNRFNALQQFVQSTLLLASTLAVLVAGGWAVAAGRISRGEIMSFYVIAALFANQARAIVESIPAVRMGIRAYGKIEEVLRIAEQEPYQGCTKISEIREVQLAGVAFGYRDRALVIEEASVRIVRGERVGLIGANGSGKSSLLLLIAGFYRPSKGALSVNGIPYDEVDYRSLRSRIAIVPQNPFLFTGSIRANLTYGQEQLSDESVTEAIRLADAEGFISQLPDGLETTIGDQGVRLSGGQRQRLVIARALLRRPDLLILDEPTNHLDEQGIESLMESLGRLPERPAVLMISHEPRVLRHTSRALRLSEGRLEELVPEPRA